VQNFAHSERRNGTISIEGSTPAIKSETHGRSLIVEFFRIGTTISTNDFKSTRPGKTMNSQDIFFCG